MKQDNGNRCDLYIVSASARTA